MGLTMVLDLLIENPACRVDPAGWIAEMMIFGVVSGLGGSLVSHPAFYPVYRTRMRKLMDSLIRYSEHCSSEHYSLVTTNVFSLINRSIDMLRDGRISFRLDQVWICSVIQQSILSVAVLWVM